MLHSEVLKPCGRCEQELPESAFDNPDALFCKQCTAEIVEIIRQKYNVIEAAHIRAKVRRASRTQMQDRFSIT